jgi:carbamoyl-phosphate synthase large subunit
MNILVTSAGSNTSIGILKELRCHQQQLGLVLHGTDSNELSSCAGVFFLDHFFQIPSVYHTDEYKQRLLDIIEQYNIQCVIPVHDKEIEMIASIKKEFPSLTYWAVNDLSVILACNNKLIANETAEKAGLNVPSYTQEINKLNDFNWPIIIKPVNGVSSNGIQVINSTGKLASTSVTSTEFCQEYIEGGIEYTVDCYCTSDAKFYGGIARIRTETKAGISSKGITVHRPDIIACCRRFLEMLNYRGASNLQFIEYNDILYFIEINPRFSGAGVLSFKAGFTSPLFTVLEAMNKSLPNELTLEYGVKMARYWEEVFFDAKGDII